MCNFRLVGLVALVVAGLSACAGTLTEEERAERCANPEKTLGVALAGGTPASRAGARWALGCDD